MSSETSTLGERTESVTRGATGGMTKRQDALDSIDDRGVIGGTNFPRSGSAGIASAALDPFGALQDNGLSLGYLGGRITVPGRGSSRCATTTRRPRSGSVASGRKPRSQPAASSAARVATKGTPCSLAISCRRAARFGVAPATALTSRDRENSCGQLLYDHYWGSGFLPTGHQGVEFRSGADGEDRAGTQPSLVAVQTGLGREWKPVQGVPHQERRQEPDHGGSPHCGTLNIRRRVLTF